MVTSSSFKEQSANVQAGTPPATVSSEGRPPTGYNPMMATHPLMNITKFTGENWTEFIEYFESVADANHWSDHDRLTFLLMSIDSKPRMYARGDKGSQQTYHDVKRRLQQRYGQNEPAFSVRTQLREIKRKPGERLEVFADRLQEVAQRGLLDPQDRDELFYFAFLNAVRDTPKMQNYIEKAHMKNRNLTLSDLLALSQEYLNRSPTSIRRTVAVNVCRTSKPTGKLTRTDDDDDDDMEDAVVAAVQQAKVAAPAPAAVPATSVGEQAVSPETIAYLNGRISYVQKEMEWTKWVVKTRGFHKGLSQKYKESTGGGNRDNQGNRSSGGGARQSRGGSNDARGAGSPAGGPATAAVE